MSNSRNRNTIIIVLLLAGFAVLQFDLLEVIRFEDFSTYDDRNNPPYLFEENFQARIVSKFGGQAQCTEQGTYQDEKWIIDVTECIDCGGLSYVTANNQITKTNDEITLLSPRKPCRDDRPPGNAGTTTLETSEDFRGRDIKISATSHNCWVTPSGGVFGGTSTITVGNKVITFGASCSRSSSVSTSRFIEVFSSKLDSNQADLFVDGSFVQTLNFAGMSKVPVRFTTSAQNLEIKFFGFKIPFSCEQSGEELLGLESFVGGRTLSITDLRFQPTKFCLDHPAIITSEDESGSTSTAEIYQRLSQGEVLNIPQEQTWTVFYIFYNDGSIPQSCPDEFYDVEKEKCIDLTGIVQFCSEGTFDPNSGTCTVTPEVRFVCEIGRFDEKQQVCIFNPPNQAVCDIGRYNSITGKCEFTPEHEFICEENYVYNPTTNVCEGRPLSVIDCGGLSFNPQTGLCEGSGDEVLECPEGTVEIGDDCQAPIKEKFSLNLLTQTQKIIFLIILIIIIGVVINQIRKK